MKNLQSYINMYYSIDGMQLEIINETSEGYHIFKIITFQHLIHPFYKNLIKTHFLS